MARETALDDRARKGCGHLNGVVPDAAIDPVEMADEAILLHSEHDRAISGRRARV